MTTTHAMGWRPGPMQARSTLKAALKRRTPRCDRFYKTSLVLDQGASRASAAYAIWHWLVMQDRSFVGINPEGLVRLAYPKGEPAAVLIEALIEMLRRHGILGPAYWTRNAAHLRDALVQGLGAAIVGLPWLTGMLTPDAEGYIMAAGTREGRHCVVVVGYDWERDAFRILNSWGPAWGQLGRAWIRSADLQFLLAHGAACVPLLARNHTRDRGRPLEILLQDQG